MSKKLDEGAMLRELAGSAFFTPAGGPRTHGLLPSREVGKEGNREGSREIGGPPSLPAKRPGFDLAQRPYRKDSFLFTADEWEGLEDLKLALRRTHRLDATKNDLARCAVHFLIDDFLAKGVDSIAVRRLSKKGGK